LGRPIPLDVAQADERIAGRLAGDILSLSQYREAAGLIRERVSERDWEVLHLWAVDELTHAEIAERVGLASAVASRQHVSRLSRRLRKELASVIKEVA
jgi:DNA-directed RNA polymerase specialized sigma subunit